VTGKLAGGSGASETFPASRPAAVDDGTTVLGRHASQETELAHTTLLRGLERSFHGEYSG
jgi:hypothetical protein